MTIRTHGKARGGRPGRRFGRGAALVLVLAAVAVASRRCRAQGSESRAGILLTLPTSTRALGLADASAAAAPDEWATFAAPAQLALLRAPSAGLATEAYLASTRLSAVAVAVPIARGTLGVAATLLDYGNIAEIVPLAPGADGTESGRTFTAQDVGIVIGYGVPLARGVRVGGTIEFVSTRVADVSGSGVAGSVGFGWTGPKGWEIAGAVQHVGSDVTIGATSGELPLTERVAIAAPARQFGGVRFRPMLEVRHVRGAGTVLAGGAEASWTGSRGVGLTLRGGYAVRDAGDDHWPVALGAGATYGPFTLDYALERFPMIDQVTHRIGLRVARTASSAPR